MAAKDSEGSVSLLINQVDDELYRFEVMGDQRDGGFMWTNREHRGNYVYELW